MNKKPPWCYQRQSGDRRFYQVAGNLRKDVILKGNIFEPYFINICRYTCAYHLQIYR